MGILWINKYKPIYVMRITEVNYTNRKRIIQQFADWAMSVLKIQNPPTIKYSEDKETVYKHRSFGSTTPSGEIWTYVGTDRNCADVLRTLAHELVHHRQFEKGVATGAMSEEKRLEIEDQANALAGRLLRANGKKHIEIYEGRTGSLQHEVADSLPHAFIVPELDSSNPYRQYKFGVAIASVRGSQKRLDDGITPFDKSDLDEVFGDSEMIISYDPTIGDVIQQALKQIGAKDGVRRVGVTGSKESSDVGTVSPVKPFKGYPR